MRNVQQDAFAILPATPILAMVFPQDAQQISWNIKKWKQEIVAANEKYTKRKREQQEILAHVTIPAIIRGCANEQLCDNGIEIIDMPGMEETALQSASSFTQTMNSQIYKNIKSVIESCNVVLILVDPQHTEDAPTMGLIAVISSKVSSYCDKHKKGCNCRTQAKLHVNTYYSSVSCKQTNLFEVERDSVKSS